MFGTTGTNFSSIINSLIAISNSLIWLMSGVALVVFLLGMVRYIANASDSKAHKDGKNFIIWGLVGLFVIFSLAAILNEMSLIAFGGVQGPGQ